MKKPDRTNVQVQLTLLKKNKTMIPIYIHTYSFGKRENLFITVAGAIQWDRYFNV